MGRGLTDLGDRVRFLARPEVVPENHPIPLNTAIGAGSGSEFDPSADVIVLAAPNHFRIAAP